MMNGVGNYNRRASAAPHQPESSLGEVIGLLILLAIMISLRIVVSIWWIVDRLFRTHITIRPDWIVVGRNRLRRRDFNEFVVHHTLVRAGKTYAVLGYTYRNQSYPFGGVWPEIQAEEVSRALDALVKALPMTPDARRPSQEDLRRARPTDF